MTATMPPHLGSPHMASYAEAVQDPTIRSEMDTGPPKVRRRWTATITTLSASWRVTGEVLENFLAWYRSAISYGTTPFSWTHPRTGDPVTARLVGPPRWSPADGRWLLELTVEVLP